MPSQDSSSSIMDIQETEADDFDRNLDRGRGVESEGQLDLLFEDSWTRTAGKINTEL
jgi:hypothetical protein